MVQERLTALLAELHEELEKEQQLDAAARAQLEGAAAELNEFLTKAAASEEHGAFEALQERLLNLEVEHPRVAAIIGETAELISKLGV
jgi:ferritin-like protein